MGCGSSKSSLGNESAVSPNSRSSAPSETHAGKGSPMKQNIFSSAASSTSTSPRNIGDRDSDIRHGTHDAEDDGDDGEEQFVVGMGSLNGVEEFSRNKSEPLSQRLRRSSKDHCEAGPIVNIHGGVDIPFDIFGGVYSTVYPSVLKNCIQQAIYTNIVKQCNNLTEPVFSSVMSEVLAVYDNPFKLDRAAASRAARTRNEKLYKCMSDVETYIKSVNETLKNDNISFVVVRHGISDPQSLDVRRRSVTASMEVLLRVCITGEHRIVAPVDKIDPNIDLIVASVLSSSQENDDDDLENIDALVLSNVQCSGSSEGVAGFAIASDHSVSKVESKNKKISDVGIAIPGGEEVRDGPNLLQRVRKSSYSAMMSGAKVDAHGHVIIPFDTFGGVYNPEFPKLLEGRIESNEYSKIMVDVNAMTQPVFSIAMNDMLSEATSKVESSEPRGIKLKRARERTNKLSQCLGQVETYLTKVNQTLKGLKFIARLSLGDVKPPEMNQCDDSSKPTLVRRNSVTASIESYMLIECDPPMAVPDEPIGEVQVWGGRK